MVHGLNYYHGSAATLANTPYDGVLETLYQHHLSQALAGIGKKKNSKVVQVEFCNLPQNVSFAPQQHYKHEHHGEAMQISPQQQACVDQSMEANSSLAFETFFQDLEQAPTMISMMMGRPNAITPQQQQHANLVQQQHQHAHMHHDDEDCDEDEDSMGSGSPNSQKISPGNSPQEKSAVDQFLSQALTMTSGNRRANFACSECRKSHKACSGGRPCERCVKLGLSDSCRDISRKKRCVTKKHWHKFMGSANIKEQIMKVQQEFVTKCSQEQKSAQNSPRGGRRTSISAAGSSC